MEKFKRHTDKATGVNPFVPRSGSTAATRIVNGIFLPVRLLLVLLCGLLLLLINPLAIFLRAIKLGFLAKILPGPIIFALNRVLVFVSCHIVVDRQWFPAQASKSTYDIDSSAATFEGTRKGKDNTSGAFRAGDVIFVNLQSPVDCLVLESLFVGQCPLHYLFPTIEVEQSSPKPKISSILFKSPWSAMSFILGGCKSTPNGLPKHEQGLTQFTWGSQNWDISGYQAQAKHDGAALVCFAEGMPTNGRGLMQFPCIRCESGMTAVALQYTSSNISTPIPSDWLSLFGRSSSGLAPIGMLSAPTECRVTQIRPSLLPPPQSVFSTIWTDDLRNAMVKGLTSRKGAHGSCVVLQASSMAEKIAFLEHWDATMSHTRPGAASQ